MSMNGKPGWGIIKKVRPDVEDTYVGRVFLCVRSYEFVSFLTGTKFIVWVVEPPLRGYKGINDEVLFPIDPLKDDEPKELVAPLPKLENVT